jgi:hypothetical protein
MAEKPSSAGARARPPRSSSATKDKAPGADSKQGDQVRGVVVEAARTQLAAVTALMKFWSGWVESADKYTRAVDAELSKLDQSGESGDLVARLSDLTREYLRNMTQLPSAAVKEFNSQLETIGKPTAKRTRAAKVKD